MAKFSQKLLIFTLLACLSLAVSGCLKTLTPVVNTNTNQNTNAATTTEEIDTSDWKTYRNEELGVAFDYELIDKYKKGNNKLYVADNTVKICIYDDTLCNRIKIFDIGNKSPVNYILDNLMIDVNEKCRIERKIIDSSYKLQYPNNYKVFSIISLEQDETLGDLVYCGGFGNFTTLGYFLFNTDVPTKLLWVKFNNDDNFFTHPKEFLESITIF